MIDFNQYPKVLYHATKPCCVVQDENEEAMLGAGWGESPGGPPAEPEVSQAPAPTKGRRK
jgi:hypothetical protein